MFFSNNYINQFSIFNKLNLLRFSIGIIFIWFGGLKFFPNASPAQDIAINTIELITFGIFKGKVALLTLASLEVIIGTFLIFNIALRATIIVLVSHIACTFMPIIFFPAQVFEADYLLSLTLLGQYIVKNIVIVCSSLLLYK